MKAKQARKDFYEKYIEFEWLVRSLARKRISGYSTKGTSLNEIILALGARQSINNKEDGFTTKDLKKHKNIRNWLAHQPPNANLGSKQLKSISGIKSLNRLIKNAIKK